jgi:hypothetical protein
MDEPKIEPAVVVSVPLPRALSVMSSSPEKLSPQTGGEEGFPHFAPANAAECPA